MKPSEPITVERSVLFDLLVHCVTATRQLGLIDEGPAELAATAAQRNVNYVGRAIAELIGASTVPFEDPPPSAELHARVLVVSGARSIEALADLVLAMCPSNAARSSGFGWRDMPLLPDVPIDDDDDSATGPCLVVVR